MGNTVEINSFDEAIRVIWLESSKVTNEEPENISEFILDSEVTSNLSENKRDKLVDELFEKSKIPSFGLILSDAIIKNNVSMKEINEITNLSENVINDLQKDNIFINNIPILLFKKLLDFTKISFEKAETSIYKTFEILKNKDILNKIYSPGLCITQRKESKITKELTTSNKIEITGKNLYENKESLQRYLSHLKEIL